MKSKTYKTILILLGFLAVVGNPFPVSAQNSLTQLQKVTAAETLYKLVEAYRQTSGMKSYDKNIANAEAVNKYVVLFEPGAEIINDIKPKEIGILTDKPTPTTVEEFTSDILDYFSSGLQVDIKSANIDFSTIGKDTVIIAINKITSGKTANRTGIGTSLYKSQTEQILYVHMNSDFTAAKIVKAVLLSGNLFCVDCKQQELEQSEIQEKLPFEFAMTIAVDGPLTSALGNSPDYSKMNYDRLVAANGNSVGYKNNLGFGGGLNLSFDFMFTKERNVGLSVAVGYSHQVTSFGLDALHLEYTAHNITSRINDPFFDEYLRYNSARKIKETVNSDNAGVSLLFKYQSNPADNLGFFFQFGPSYYFFNQSVSKYSAIVDHEAIYQPAKIKNQAQTYDASGHVAATDWEITKANLRPGSDVDPVKYFQDLRNLGYDVYIDKRIEGKSSTNKFGLAIGGALAGGLMVKVSPTVQFLAGASANVIYYTKNNLLSNQTLLDDRKGYNSLLNSVENTLKINYGITLGFKFRLVTLN